MQQVEEGCAAGPPSVSHRDPVGPAPAAAARAYRGAGTSQVPEAAAGQFFWWARLDLLVGEVGRPARARQEWAIGRDRA